MLNERNTFILDDRDAVCFLNKSNCILIPEYEVEMTVKGISKCDDELLKLMGWLMTPEVRESTDVRQLDTRRIFKRKADDYINFF